jgi:hypothetical protein
VYVGHRSKNPPELQIGKSLTLPKGKRNGKHILKKLKKPEIYGKDFL